jgi:predicted oxidoreductase
MWTDGDAGGGTHGYRGIEVTDDGSEVHGRRAATPSP